MTRSIFEGIKVLDLTRVVSGPWATQTLADMGATVYKIEEPGVGDMTRRLVPMLKDEHGEPVPGLSAFYLGVNRGKQSLQVDLAKPEGADLVRRLAARCDVVIENYKAGGLKKYGLDYESVRQKKPDIVYCSVSGFGIDGPYAKRPAYDFILQGLAGLMSTCGHPDGVPGAMPMRTAVPITDIFTGLYAAIAVQGALYHRLRTGVGQFIDIGMIDASVAVNAHLALEFLMTGKAPTRAGNTNPVGAPSDVFECTDGYVIIAAGSDKQFAAMCDTLGHPEWAQDERFSSPPKRIAHREPLRQLIAEVVRHRSKGEWQSALEAAVVPCSQINSLGEVFDDPQVRHRQLAMELEHPSGIRVPTLRSPLRFSETPVMHRAAPMVGEHTDVVLQRELGLAPSEVDALRRGGVLGEAPAGG